jgi:hypothetical protein
MESKGAFVSLTLFQLISSSSEVTLPTHLVPCFQEFDNSNNQKDLFNPLVETLRFQNSNDH